LREGAVFTRVAASHIRVGTFEYFAARQDAEAVRLLADHVIARHHPDAASAPNPYLALLEAVAVAQADLIAHWMSLGFIHGVMNTDNTAISGETIDYGPCAFMDVFHPRAVFSSIDVSGRYAWGSQPDIGLWNVTRFAETLRGLLADEQSAAIAKAEAALARYPERFREQYATRFRAKLGLGAESPVAVIDDCLNLLAAQQIDFTLFFRRLTRVAAGDDDHALSSMFRDVEPFTQWFETWRRETGADRRAAMCAANPARIPRNHRVEEAIQSGDQGDYAPFHRLLDAVAAPYEDRPEHAALETPPAPHEVVRATFCGT
jgi:serine/tyrosine/threonine adenylyltransferase